MKYEAFISYSQSADGELAEALQSGLQRLGRPWYRPRPTMRVFRDKTGFGASEDLTESIREVLDSSSYLILLLSPQAASSQWVDEEVSHWIAGKEAGHVLPVVTHWDSPPGASSENLGLFRWDGADVPPALRAYYDTEPLAVDLRWASTGRDLHLRNERFTEAVAEVASPILGKQKDELIGETIRLRRRARRLAIGAIVGLVVLTVAVAVAGLVAVQNARRADERARVAQSRQLAAQATSLAEGDVDVALLLAVEGMRIDPTAEARSALLRTVTRYSGLSLYLHLDRGNVNDLRFAEDGTLAAVSAGSTLSVWGPDDPLNPSHLETDDTAILNSFDLHPGAAYAVAGGDAGGLHVFDLAAGIGRLAVPGAHDGRITDVRFLAGGRNLVTAGSDGTMAFWSFQDGTLNSDGSVAVSGGVRDLITIEDQDRVVVGLDTGAVEVWRLSERVRLGGVTRPFAVNALAYAPASDLLAAGGADGRVALYRLATLEEIADLPATRASLISVGTLLFSSDGGRLLAGNADGTIRMWTAPAWAELSTELGGHTGTVSALAASSDGATIASGASDQAVILWDLTSPSVIAEPIHTPKTETGALAVSTTDLLAVGGVDGAAVWDLEAGEWVLPNLSAFGRAITAIVFDPDGKRVAYGTLGGDMVVWDAIGDELIQDELGAHSGSDSLLPAVWDVTMDNEVVVSAGTDGAVRMWSEGGVEDLATHPGGATSVDLEGSTLVSTGADIEVHVWRPPGAAVESALPGAFTAAIAPGEHLLALQDPQGGIVLWDLDTETRIGRLWGATAPPTRLSFSPDGSILASGHQNGDVLLWDPVNLVAIGGPLRAHNDAVQSIEFHPRGTHLFSGSLDGRVMAWDLQVVAWAQEACRVANRDLTEAEWVTYLGEVEPYRATCSTLGEETFDGVAGSAVQLRLPDAPAGPSAAGARTTTP